MVQPVSGATMKRGDGDPKVVTAEGDVKFELIIISCADVGYVTEILSGSPQSRALFLTVNLCP